MQIKIIEEQVLKVNTSAGFRAGKQAEDESENQNRNSIFAGDLNMQDDAVTVHKKYAQKRAMKFISDAWAVDRNIDEGMDEIRADIEEMRSEAAAYQDIIAEGNAEKERLQEEYGVEGSKERCMEIDESQEEYKRRIANLEGRIAGANMSIRDTKLGRLEEVPPMVKAQKNAKKVLKNASRETIGMLMEEAKDHVDKTYEEVREEVKEKAEEKEEREERVEDLRDKKEAMEEQIDASQENNHKTEEMHREQQERSRDDTELLEHTSDDSITAGDPLSDAQSEIKELLRKLKLLEEDLKGASVDEEL